MASADTVPSLRPRAGTAWVRPIVAAESLPGSRLILPPQVVDRLTTTQMELLAMGPPLPLEEGPDPDAEALAEARQALPVGAWLVVKPRSWIEGPTPATFLVSHDAILGWFRP